MTARPTDLRLFNYFRSSASYRVRIALHLKGLAFEYVPVHLIQNGGEQKSEAHRLRNPAEQVPTLEYRLDGKTRMLAQSIAIIEFLDEAFPEVPVLPRDLFARARARELAELVNSGIQPHQNLEPMKHIDSLAPGGGKVHAQLHNRLGLAAYETRLADTRGRFSVGDEVSIADLCLVPQLVAARRFGVDVAAYPSIVEVEKNCLALEAFQKAAPERQPDFA